MQQTLAFPAEVSEGLDEVVDRLQKLGFNGFSDSTLTNASMHLIRAKGKLVRPALTLLGSYCTNGIVPVTIDAAVAVELIHTASLIHDDMIDGDDVRRGVATVHSEYGPEIALLSGDMLISKAIEVSSTCGVDAIRELARAAMDMCEGEARDYQAQKRVQRLSVEDYVATVELKTASLLGSCAAIGGIVSGCSQTQSEMLREYGRSVGLAFQIRDDYFNFQGLQLDKPKTTGNDVRKNRPNVIGSLLSEMDAEEAVAAAKRMNAKFIQQAKLIAERIGPKASLLAGYAELMSIT